MNYDLAIIGGGAAYIPGGTAPPLRTAYAPL